MSFLLVATMLVAAESQLFREKERVEYDNEEVRRLGVYFGDCVVKRKPDLARAYVLGALRVAPAAQSAKPIYTVRDALARTKEEGELTNKLAIGQCVLRPSDPSHEVGMRFTGDTMRYALADAIFKLDFASRPPLSNLEQVPQLGQTAFLNKFGECIVRYDSRGAYALLRARVLKPEENAAFGALQPAMSACLAPKSTVKLNKIMIRGTVAYNYVLLANASQPKGTGVPVK